MSELSGKNIVLGVTGGIAAYKAAELCRLFIKAGATVRVVMTQAATEFITPLTLQTLSGAPVGLNLFDADEEARIGHIRLGDDADLIVVAPATANSISRLAAGAADDLLSTVVLASRAPVLLAPAMNVNMWENPFTQQNLGRLLALPRFRTVGPDAGELACGWVGEGRLIDPAEIVAASRRLLARDDLVGKRVVVTAGPTFEPIDDVRFIGNRSSGKMGFAMAAAAARRGAAVTLIAGPVALATPIGGGIVRQDVETAAEMGAALAAAVDRADVVVMAAAVADFRPAARVQGKLSRRSGTDAARVPGQLGVAGGAAVAAAGPAGGGTRDLPLVANPDLLAGLARGRRSGRPLLVGFAAELGVDAAELVRRAAGKLAEKKCDIIIANDVGGGSGIGFGSDNNAVTIVFSDGRQTQSLPRASKSAIAEGIWDLLVAGIEAADTAAPADRGQETPPVHGKTVAERHGREQAGGGRRAVVVRPAPLRGGARSRGRRG